MIKWSVLQEDIITLNVCVPNIMASKHIRKRLTKVEGLIDELNSMFGDFNILLSEMDSLSTHKISEDINKLKSTINHPGIIDIYT